MTIEEIQSVSYGMANGYVVKTGGRIVVIDTGVKGKYKLLERILASMGFDCTDIELVILTHTHYDHTGNIAECRKTSGARVAVHEAEADNLRKGRSGMPAGVTGVGKFAIALTRLIGMNGGTFEAVEPDILVTGETFDLHQYGFPGVAVHTPSHSIGSVSIVAEDGSCFPGDILFNLSRKSVMPPVGNNPELFAQHWRRLLELGARRFYPGHGKPFDRERLEAQLADMSEQKG